MEAEWEILGKVIELSRGKKDPFQKEEAPAGEGDFPEGELKIVTNLQWPSFRNVALGVQKALAPYCRTVLIDRRDAKPGGKILFIETLRQDTLRSIGRLLPNSNVVFYGTTEGHSLIDKESREIARKLKVVAVSSFVQEMFEEVNVPVSGVVYHGIDMAANVVDEPFLSSAKAKLNEKPMALTIASNDPRKGLDTLLRAHRIVEDELPETFLILHSEPYRYYDPRRGRYRLRYCDLPSLASQLGIRNLWLTGSHSTLTEREINALYSLCYIYVLPSFSEGFGLPILEAFRFDRPVIAVDAPPFNEIIQDGSTGRLFPYEKVKWINYRNEILFKMFDYSPTSLSEAIVELLIDKKMRKEMENKIRKKKHDWSIHHLYPRLLDYF